MSEMNWIQRLVLWWQTRRNNHCQHVFRKDFSEQVTDKWERCSGALMCEKCGNTYFYSFDFEHNQGEQP